jgi:hypothetical protein
VWAVEEANEIDETLMSAAMQPTGSPWMGGPAEKEV